jgi:hypothetical protein
MPGPAYTPAPREDTVAALIRRILLALVLACPAAPAAANVITDWDAIALAPPPPMGQRELAMVDAAMFDAVNSIDRRYRPYLTQLPALKTTSQEAAAATAAATVLLDLHPNKAAEINAGLTTYLGTLADGTAKSDGAKLGAAIAAKLLQKCANDRSNAPDSYRPKTKPGAYVPTALTVGVAFSNVVPFVMTNASQFRPQPPIALTSPEWAADYNEIKTYGGKSSTLRSAEQTEAARFWLMIGPAAYHPLARQLVAMKQMSVVDSARFMALYAIALSDALAAVFDAKYRYEFWRPITAIRNGDIDDNAATERDAIWQPIDVTPMHPEYPCAHCASAGAAVTVIQSVIGSTTVPELTLTSTTAPGVTHRFRSLDAFSDEVSQARIWAGFHYRFSARVGTDLGRTVGRYVVEHTMQPV